MSSTSFGGGAGPASDGTVALALGLVWLAHIGADRVMGYGLKYDDNFQHSHLGWLGRQRPRPALREHVEASSS